jgi:hypothetical protein
VTGPAPYPADTRAKGWRFELDHERIRQSDTWALAAADIRPWLLMLWMVAWEQTPCGSMPTDPNLIAAKLGMSRRTFDKNSAVLLRGWTEALDGRLYHPVLTERVRELLEYRDAAAKRKADYRAKVLAERGVPQESHGTDTGLPRDSHGKNGTSTGTGTGTLEEKERPSVSPSVTGLSKFPPGFDAFWDAYPRKIGKDAAIRAYAKRRFTVEQRGVVLNAIATQRNSEAWTREAGRFIPHPATWLNEGRWQDEVLVAGKADRYAGSTI